MTNIDQLINNMTIEEKATLLEGHDSWKTNAISRLNIDSLFLTDGPHGLRKVRQSNGGFGISNNEYSTAFPTSVTLASTWNLDLAYKMGESIAEECLSAEVDILLAPGINIKRSPLCGRNFEYYSEDPFISGKFGVSFVKGVQDNGIGCSVKHFAVNSNENFRFVGDSIVDERALREIYLRAFESVIKEAKPATLMCSYNQINGKYAANNKWLLTEVLRHEWNFDGLVMTDWGATFDRVEDIKAGCDLEMPGDVTYNRQSIINAVQNGKLPVNYLDQSVERIIKLVKQQRRLESLNTVDYEAHETISCTIAKEGAVLLKNNGSLPLKGTENILIVGEMFEKMRFQGAGSSLINPPKIISPKEAFDQRKIQYRYEKGYCNLYPKLDHKLKESSIKAAELADTIIFFGGLTDFEESEGFDREHMKLPQNQIELLQSLCLLNKKIILVLFTGSPVEIPAFDDLSALLTMHLPGMYGGEAVASLLYGEVNPSGKLTESWLKRIEDSSCYADYNISKQSFYYESIYVGYRAYEKLNTDVRFPFGYGLSYTTFDYSQLIVNQSHNEVEVHVNITNSGQFEGAEIVQLYVKNNISSTFKAIKELRAFTKVHLKINETKTVALGFKISDLSYWNVEQHRWVLENGEYTLCIATSSLDIRLTSPLIITSGENIVSPYSESIELAYALPPTTIPSCFSQLIGYEIPKLSTSKLLTIESQLADFKQTLFGKIVYSSIMYFIKKDYKKALKMKDSLERDSIIKNSYFVYKLMPSNSIRSMCFSSGGKLNYNIAEALVDFANGRFISCCRKIMKHNV